MSGGQYQTSYGINDTGVVDLVFSCTGNGSGAIDQTTNRGEKLTTTARTSIGLYTFTLNETVKQVLWMDAVVDDVTGGTTNLKCSCYCDETASPLVVKVFVRDISVALSDTTTKIRLSLKAKLSGVGISGAFG